MGTTSRLRDWRKSRFFYKGKVTYESSKQDGTADDTEDRDQLSRLFDNDAVMVREQMLFLLLNGKYKPRDDARHRLEHAEIHLDKPWNVVMVCLIDDFEQFKQENSDSRQNMLIDEMKSYFEKLSGRIGKGYCVSLVKGNGVAILVNGEEKALNKNNLLRLASEAQEYLRNHYLLKLSIGFGPFQAGLGNFHTAYLEAFTAAKYRFLYGKQSVQFFEDLPSRYCVKHYVIPRDIESTINLGVKLGQEDLVMEAVKQVVAELAAQEIALEAAQLACSNLVSFLASSVQELGLPIPGKSMGLMGRLMNKPSETLAVFQSDLNHLVVCLCTCVNEARKSKNTVLKDQVINYINKNYQDQTLCLAGIASVFDLSTGHITRFIKDQTGYSLMRYLDKIRMDRAKCLLKETTFTVKFIVEQTGYVDETNFIRKFKKNEGVTPIQYRNLN